MVSRLTSNIPSSTQTIRALAKTDTHEVTNINQKIQILAVKAAKYDIATGKTTGDIELAQTHKKESLDQLQNLLKNYKNMNESEAQIYAESLMDQARTATEINKDRTFTPVSPFTAELNAYDNSPSAMKAFFAMLSNPQDTNRGIKALSESAWGKQTQFLDMLAQRAERLSQGSEDALEAERLQDLSSKLALLSQGIAVEDITKEPELEIQSGRLGSNDSQSLSQEADNVSQAALAAKAKLKQMAEQSGISLAMRAQHAKEYVNQVVDEESKEVVLQSLKNADIFLYMAVMDEITSQAKAAVENENRDKALFLIDFSQELIAIRSEQQASL